MIYQELSHWVSDLLGLTLNLTPLLDLTFMDMAP